MQIIFAGIFFVANWLVPLDAVKMEITAKDGTLSLLRISDTSWEASYYDPATPPKEIGEFIINKWEIIFKDGENKNIYNLKEELIGLENLDWETVDSFQPNVEEITSYIYIIREENQITLTQKENPIFDDPVIIKYYFE